MNTLNANGLKEAEKFSKDLRLMGLAIQVADELGDDRAKNELFSKAKELVGKAEVFARCEKIDTSFEPVY